MQLVLPFCPIHKNNLRFYSWSIVKLPKPNLPPGLVSSLDSTSELQNTCNIFTCFLMRGTNKRKRGFGGKTPIMLLLHQKTNKIFIFFFLKVSFASPFFYLLYFRQVFIFFNFSNSWFSGLFPYIIFLDIKKTIQ